MSLEKEIQCDAAISYKQALGEALGEILVEFDCSSSCGLYKRTNKVTPQSAMDSVAKIKLKDCLKFRKN